ncbi:hypothetical protein [Mesorhizobium sp. M1322]|uniref:hypothetical protein n=1 Tax=Mesorhizobium sp. M1322 TaxID=2957081 RepID=UPI0033390CB0
MAEALPKLAGNPPKSYLKLRLVAEVGQEISSVSLHFTEGASPGVLAGAVAGPKPCPTNWHWSAGVQRSRRATLEDEGHG